MLKSVEIYTDGACSYNPGPGGWCAILSYGEYEKVIHGGEENTTNNRMEMIAVIKGLELLKYPCNVKLYSDSAYVVNAFLNNWIDDWKRNHFKGGKVKNIDLWEKLIDLTALHNVEFIKVKGHADCDKNNRCDKFARKEVEKILNKNKKN